MNTIEDLPGSVQGFIGIRQIGRRLVISLPRGFIWLDSPLYTLKWFDGIKVRPATEVRAPHHDLRVRDGHWSEASEAFLASVTFRCLPKGFRFEHFGQVWI